MLPLSGKFLIYTSNSPNRNRLQIIGSAVSRIAETLRVDIEIARKTKLLSTYVYYKDCHGQEEIPIYCDWGKTWNEKEVYDAIRSIMFALSFHPKYTALQTMRKQIA